MNLSTLLLLLLVVAIGWCVGFFCGHWCVWYGKCSRDSTNVKP